LTHHGLDSGEATTFPLIVFSTAPLDFEKAFDRIEWDFLFTALTKLGFSNTWVRWVHTLYHEASSTIRINGEAGLVFQLA
jgi:hypothetical protein